MGIVVKSFYSRPPFSVYAPKSQNLESLDTGMVTDGVIWKHFACGILQALLPTAAAGHFLCVSCVSYLFSDLNK